MVLSWSSIDQIALRKLNPYKRGYKIKRIIHFRFRAVEAEPMKYLTISSHFAKLDEFFTCLFNYRIVYTMYSMYLVHITSAIRLALATCTLNRLLLTFHHLVPVCAYTFLLWTPFIISFKIHMMLYNTKSQLRNKCLRQPNPNWRSIKVLIEEM